MQLGVIGNYNEGTGWSHAITNFLLAAKTAVPVVCRPLRLNKNPITLHPEVQKIEQEEMNCTHLLQYVLPPYMTYRGGFKNIGRFVIESDSIIPSWREHLKLMDELWVPTNFMKSILKNYGFDNVKVIPENTQVAEIQRAAPANIKEQTNTEFLFYFIGEINKRKNLKALIQAFHLEFSPYEPVNLVIKASTGLPPDQGKQHMIKMIDDIKAGLKIRQNYKHEIIITERLTEEQMWALHKGCDCLVAPSYGEGWHRPALDAMCAGKTPIVTGWSSFTDFIDNDCGWLVDYHPEPCFGHIDTIPELNSSREKWASINIDHLRACMRQAYEDSSLKQQKSINGMQKAWNYSNEAVGRIIKTCVES